VAYIHKTEDCSVPYCPNSCNSVSRIIDDTDIGIEGAHMVKQLLTLTCKSCGKKFEAHARRRVVHCQKCAEELRRERLGPVQIERKPAANSTFGKPQAKEIAWEHSERDLIYYLHRFNRFPTYDGVMPSDPDQITDEDRRIANQIAARTSAETWAQVVGQSIAQIGDWDLFNMSDFEEVLSIGV